MTREIAIKKDHTEAGCGIDGLYVVVVATDGLTLGRVITEDGTLVAEYVSENEWCAVSALSDLLRQLAMMAFDNGGPEISGMLFDIRTKVIEMAHE